MTLAPAIAFDIETLASTAAARRILIIGHASDSILTEYEQQCRALGTPLVIETSPPDSWLQSTQSGSFDLIIAVNVIESWPTDQGIQFVAALRDRQSAPFCLLYDWQQATEHTPWQLTDFLSLGMVRVNQYQWQGVHSALFKYSIDSYKRTPDWLNPDNWANPDLWGKYWW